MPLALLFGAKRIALAAFGWLRSLNVWQLLCLALAGFALLFYLQRNDARSDAGRWEKQYHGERAARLADRQAYQDAQIKAREQMRAENKRIEREQQKVTDNVEADLNARLERLRRELRGKAAAPQGAPGSNRAPAVPGAAKGADGEAQVCLAPGDFLRAAENEERHDQLITWVEQQLSIKR